MKQIPHRHTGQVTGLGGQTEIITGGQFNSIFIETLHPLILIFYIVLNLGRNDRGVQKQTSQKTQEKTN